VVGQCDVAHGVVGNGISGRPVRDADLHQHAALKLEIHRQRLERLAVTGLSLGRQVGPYGRGADLVMRSFGQTDEPESALGLGEVPPVVCGLQGGSSRRSALGTRVRGALVT
jgi:hypothetical protein